MDKREMIARTIHNAAVADGRDGVPWNDAWSPQAPVRVMRLAQADAVIAILPTLDKHNGVAAAIEHFIATPQISQHYLGDLAIGFEMRRDLPRQYAGGFWFSAKAVEMILAALSSHKGIEE